MLHLDLLRFIASVGIVIHHSREFFYPVSERAYRQQHFTDIALFVDVFFVLSGFVIAYVYSDRIRSGEEYGRFLQRRVGRLLPLHWVTLLVSILTWSVFVKLGFAGKHMPSTNPVCVAETALLLQAFLHCGNEISFNSQSWSISAEGLMYIAFPLTAFKGVRSGKLLLSASLLLTLCAADVALRTKGGVWTELPAVMRVIPMFLLGCAMFQERVWLARLPKPQNTMIVSTSLLVAGLALNLPELALLPLIFLVVASAAAADIRGCTSALVMRFAPLGQLTYSIYMWHGLVILLVMNALGDKFLHAGPMTMTGLAVVCYAAIGMVSYLSFFFVETPLRKRIDGVRLFQ